MTVNSYFALTDSLGSAKKFRVIFQGYEPLLDKVQSIQTTVDGNLDAAFGGIYETHTYNIKVREEENETGFGNKKELESYYRLNNPHGSPSNILILTDHYGGNHNIYMVGQHLPLPLGVVIEGPDAYFIVKCTFKFMQLLQTIII